VPRLQPALVSCCASSAYLVGTPFQGIQCRRYSATAVRSQRPTQHAGLFARKAVIPS
jgi:hypothetical protein